MGDQNLEDSYVPIGFKFSPTDDELISFFLKNKTEYPGEFNLPEIPETKIYEHLPQELLGTRNKGAYFFTQRNRRHAKGSYVDRSVKEGYGHWRMTGSGKGNEIKGVDGSVIGYKNSLTFYTGKNRKEGKGTDWLMNEYVMKEKVGCNSSMKLDDWVICRVHLRNSCNNRQKIGSERKRIRMSAEVPGPVQHQQYEDQFGANNLQYSEMSSNAILNIQHHQENHYQLGGYSEMIHQQYYSQQLQQQFEQQQQQLQYQQQLVYKQHSQPVKLYSTIFKSSALFS
ncbi:hypothetical protein MKW94_026195 [Papaver nudicaule]|uniref:NAC domain-containing protein n=1 Tax=Papaver nudicaule TaxID=74823 RepID=A0AA42ASD3_PAPNU|nr:hypothetical protein [Papaver nudicaule]